MKSYGPNRCLTNKMRLPASLALLLLVTSHHAAAQGGIGMEEIQSCQVGMTGEAINQGRWGGVIATYDVSVTAAGGVVAMQSRNLEKSANLIRWVTLDQFERCITQWKFDNAGSYAVSLTGGTVFGNEWIIDVRGADGRRLRFRMKRP